MTWGIKVPQAILDDRGPPVRWWGARAIFHPGEKEPIDLLMDRQSCESMGGRQRHPICHWLDDVGLPGLQKLAEFKRLSVSDHVDVTYKEGQFTLVANPKGSYGYLYLGAWQHYPKGCIYEMPEPDLSAKWSGQQPPPPLGAAVVASINGEWQGVVTGYFVEHGWLGIETTLTLVPEWKQKQDPGEKHGYFFGCDLRLPEVVA